VRACRRQALVCNSTALDTIGVMSDSLTRIPPQSLDSERGLLGAILLKPEAIHDISDTVRADSFYAEKHRMIFECRTTPGSRSS
jgi:hypothetical protein